MPNDLRIAKSKIIKTDNSIEYISYFLNVIENSNVHFRYE